MGDATNEVIHRVRHTTSGQNVGGRLELRG